MSAPLPSRLPGIDISAALKNLNGNEMLLRRLMTSFLTHYQTADKDLRSLIAEHKYEEAERQAHSIKNLGGQLAAKLLQASSKQLESAIREKREEEYSVLLDNFEGALNRVVKSVQSIDLQ